MAVDLDLYDDWFRQFMSFIFDPECRSLDGWHALRIDDTFLGSTLLDLLLLSGKLCHPQHDHDVFGKPFVLKPFSLVFCWYTARVSGNVMLGVTFQSDQEGILNLEVFSCRYTSARY